MTGGEGCAFCAIAGGQAAAEIVLDEPEVMGFLDVRPVFPGHVLIVPRAHFETLTDLPEAVVPVVFGAARRVAGAVVEAMDAHGSFIGINNKVSQSVPHLHVHVVPRRFKDGLRGFFWPRQRYGPGEMAAVAGRIRASLQGSVGP